MTSNFNKGDNVYLDTGFLVAYSLPYTQGGKYTTTAKKLMAEMIINKCHLMVSTLSFDELWRAVKDEKDALRKEQSVKRKINKVIKKIGRFTVSGYSYTDIMSDLKLSTESLLKLPLKFLNFSDASKGILESLKLLETHITSKPRDSFHASLAKEHKVTVFIGRDVRFLKGISKLGIKPIDISTL